MFSSGGGEVGLEAFVALVQSLGYWGSLDTVLDLFRTATALSGGRISVDGVLAAMDDAAFHFFTIDLPGRPSAVRDFIALPKEMIEMHWRKFGSWFDGFREKAGIESWTRSELARRVERVDALFSACVSASSLFLEYRGLLDEFQRALAARAAPISGVMDADKCERQLLLLENSVDLLMSFVSRHGGFNYREFPV
jgi:hypothetical protein